MVRRKPILFALANILAFGFLINLFWPLIYLLFVTGEADRIHTGELVQSDMTIGFADDSRVAQDRKATPTSVTVAFSDSDSESDLSADTYVNTSLIPRIIHQTWITCAVPELLSGNCTTKPIPEKWTEAWKSVKAHNPDYEYKLWTDQVARDFIEKEYSWFLPTWDGYIWPVQRADAIRYFVIYHFGGIYIDLDDGCQRSLDPLLGFPVWVRRTQPTGIGNDVIGAEPQHPFIELAMNSLPDYDVHWPIPYIHIMFSTGPMFFSLMWEKYNKMASASGAPRIRLLFPEEYMFSENSFFVHYAGNSWHQWDANAIFWMRSHWIGLTVAGFMIVVLMIGSCWCCLNHLSFQRHAKYEPLKDLEA